MRDKVERFIAENKLLNINDNIVVALSGGADSVTLLHMLVSIKEKYNFKIYAAHFNHQIRGEEAQKDEKFVCDLCEKYKVTLFVERKDILSLSKERKISVELCGRDERYRFFEALSKQLKAKVATAHTLSDNAETVLLNITRGASLSGLCGIPIRRDYIIRPLLCLTRAEIESYCNENALSYVTDKTNFEEDYSRNKIRLSVIPKLKQINSGVEENIKKLSGLIQLSDKYLDNISKKELKSCKNEYGYSCEKLTKLDKAVRFYAIKNILNANGADFEYRHILLIDEALRSHKSVNLPSFYLAECSQGTLRIIKKSSDIQATKADFECKLNDYSYKKYVTREELKKINKKDLINYINCDIITDATVIRTKNPGDTFTLKDRNVTKTLKKLYNELKIPREQRNALLVVANGSTVLWAQKIGVSMQGKVEPDYTEKAVRILGDSRGEV